jgi:serine protease AprX
MPGYAGHKLAPDLASYRVDTIDVIIQFKEAPSRDQLDKIAARGHVKHIFDHIHGVHASLPMREVESLAKEPSVAYVSPDRKVTVQAANNWGVLDMVGSTVNAPAAWRSGLDGTGISVAIIDSGITQKDDLMTADNSASRIVYSQTFVPGQDATDLYGHGTHVAGIAGGNGADSSGNGVFQTFKGIAPNINIVNLKVGYRSH